MTMMDINILHKLISVHAPSNFETDMREYIKSVIPNNKHLSIISDRNTSLAFYLNKGKKKTVLIDAHMDEISGQIVSINDKGFITIQMTGPLIEHMHGRPVTIFSSILNKKIPGVILIQHAHLKQTRKEKKDEYNKEILYVDIGSSSKKETKSKVEIGDPVIVDYLYTHLKKNIITSRGLDNKLGVFVLIHLLLYCLKHGSTLQYNVIFNFTGDEETGRTSVSHFKDIILDSIIVIDTDWASDVPFINQDVYGVADIGKGAIVTRSDVDDGLFERFKTISKKHNIPIQVSVPIAGETTMSHYIQQYTTRTQFLGMALRNIHSPVEIANIKDTQSVFDLVKFFLTQKESKKMISKQKKSKRRTSKPRTSKQRTSKQRASKQRTSKQRISTQRRSNQQKKQRTSKQKKKKQRTSNKKKRTSRQKNKY
jgi:putative aminopeptidase FrvX